MSIQKKIRALWRPVMYHGWGKSTSYFEGWYLKMIDSTRSHAYAIIPGISLGDNGENHAFIQVLDGMAKKATTTSLKLLNFNRANTIFP